MIRVLAMIAVAGFVLSFGAISAAVALGGPELVGRHGWGRHDWRDGRWDGWRHHRHDGPWGRDRGPTVSRTYSWAGGDTLSVDFPADVRYVQRAGPPSLTISGPQHTLDDVQVDADGAIQVHGHSWRHGKLAITLAAPGVWRFEVPTAGALRIESYDQDRLALDIAGAGEVTASGRTRAVEVDISGAGSADLGALKARDADVEISGAGRAEVAPTESARLEISGMGVINLLTNPAQLTTDISGAGQIRRAAPEGKAPSPAPAAPGKI
jgi:hypothetical protein